MLAILAFLLTIPRDVRCLIWSFVLDVPLLDMANEYQFSDKKGRLTLTEISEHCYRPDRALAYRIFYNHHHHYKQDMGAHMCNLLKAHAQGNVRHVGSILRINLHTLFSTRSFYLARAKKVIMLALQMRMVTKVEFQTWEYFNEDGYHYYECVPYELFLEHIAPCLRNNHRNIPIAFDTYYKPEDEVEKELVFDWEYSPNYNDTDAYPNFFTGPDTTLDLDTLMAEPQEIEVCRDWVKAIGAKELRGWADQVWEERK